MAQVIARGGVPYRDAVNIKTPLSAYIGAAAIVLTRPFGLRDILAIRIVSILLASVTIALVFIVTQEFTGDLRIALLAAAIMLTFRPFIGLNIGGIQPKTPMILFGLLALRAGLDDRPLKAGVMGMLSALSWQPGLLFVGTAGLGFSLYLTIWRDRRVAKLIAGASIPLLVMLGYFWMSGALKDFYAWTIDFNATEYAPGEARTLDDFFSHFAKIVNGGYGESLIYFYFSIVGLIAVLWSETRSKTSGFVESARRHAIIIAPIVYFGFCIIDIQGTADLIPLLPFVAVFGAVAIVVIVGLETNLILRLVPRLNRAMIENLTSGALIVLISFLAHRDLLSTERGSPTLEAQDLDVASIVSQLQPGDQIFVHGRAEVLALAGLTNASKYFFLDRGKDRYLSKTEEGGFDGWFERLKAGRPKIVVLGRLAEVSRAKDFEDWVLRDYQPRYTRNFDYWIRKEGEELKPAPGQ